MSDTFAGINAELENYANTHVFVGPETVGDFEQQMSTGQAIPEDIGNRRPVLLHIDRVDDDFGVQVMREGAPLPLGESGLMEEYREGYRTFVGDLRKVHRSLTDLGATEAAVLQDTAESMTGQNLHLLGGYVVGKSEQTGTLVSTLFYHKIFSDAYKRGMLASINEGGFDIRRLPVAEQERIEALARMEDSREILIACSSLIATLMPHPEQAFPET